LRPNAINHRETELPNTATFARTAIMATIQPSSSFKRLRNRYRLVIMNDDTFEEVATFRLTRLSVYVAMSTIFVLLVGITIALLSFTDMKYLIPGYGKQGAIQELRVMRMRVDSIEQALVMKQQYFNDLRRVLQGDTASMRLDTVTLELPSPDSLITD
jgi:hypothetical protein